MKKFGLISLSVITAAVLALTGCSGSSTSNVTGTAAPAGASASSAAPAVQSRELKLAYIMAPGGPAHESAQKLADIIKEKTAGKVTVKLFPNSQLGNERELCEGIKIGSIDMVLNGDLPINLYATKYTFVQVPFVFRDFEHVRKVLKGDIGKEINDQLLKDGKMVVLDYWLRGPRNITANKEIKTPADLKGLKMRVPEVKTSVEAFKLLGANPTPIAFSELFVALKQSTVDAQENPLELIYTSSFYEAQKYLIKTEHTLAAYMLSINENVFKSFSPEIQKIIQDAAEEAGNYEYDLMIKGEKDFADKLQEKGMKFVEVDKEAFKSLILKDIESRFNGEWIPDALKRLNDVK